jgi:hypothetical protein
MPAKKRLAVLIAIAALAAAVAGCGSDEIEGTIPQSNAEELTAELDAIEDASAAGRCDAAKARAQAFLVDVNELPATSGAALKETLRGAAEGLQRLVQEPCPSGATGASGPQSADSTSQDTTTPETTAPTDSQSTGSTSTPAPAEEPPSPPGGGNGNGLGNGNAGGNANGQSNGNPSGGSTGGGSTGGGGTDGTGGIGVGGN